MDISGGGASSVNKYLHKKFKKQTSIEPTTIVVANHVPIHQPIQEQQHQPFWHSTNIDTTTLKSSISNVSELSCERPDTAYTFVNFNRQHDRQEPPGGTALVVRKLDSTCSEQSDEDISNNTKIKSRSSTPKEPTHLFRSSSIIQDIKINRLIDDVIGKDDIGTARSFEAASTSSSSSSSTAAAAAAAAAASGNGKYVCPFCNLACSKPSVLQKHIRAHTNERPYPCQSCNFSFKTRSNLYKHCRSRTHVNRVMGNKTQDVEMTSATMPPSSPSSQFERPSVITDAPAGANHKDDVQPMKTKPYKPRFHTKSYYDNENEENSLAISNEKNPDPASDYINDLIDKTISIANNIDGGYEQRLPPVDGHSHIVAPPHCTNNTSSLSIDLVKTGNHVDDQPLNLTNKNRKRCLSEVSSEPAKKSLIKELLLKNLYADTNMQCPHCKMIFRTFTELELHKMKMCKGRGGGPRYSRSSSVNVASILTQNKNAFDNIPQIASMFPLKSPGPFLGKTRLVEADKSKSFSCDDGIQGGGIRDIGNSSSPFYHLQSVFEIARSDKSRKPSVKLFGGGEVKQSPASTNQHDNEDNTYPHNGQADKSDYQISPKLSENRVIRNTLQSGGIVMHAQEKQNSVIKTNEKIENRCVNGSINGDYSNIMDFSQNAAKLLAPNLKQLNLTIPGIPTPNKFIETGQPSLLAVTSQNKSSPKVISNGDMTNPMSLLVNGKVVRYVPGMPGPVIAETIKPKPIIQITPSSDDDRLEKTPPSVKIEAPRSPTITTTTNVKVEKLEPPPVPIDIIPRKKFARPDSLPLKPSTASMKHHHGLTPTMFNQILISPDTPRGDKKYNEQLIHGNYFSNLVLKSSTRPVYCTLNKTQPFYVPHFKKLSMYSEWRQQDNKSDKLYVSNYDSRQRNAQYSIAGKYNADNVVHSSYKFILEDVTNNKEESTNMSGVVKTTILGGYESHEDYTYVRGRGRGRFVCDQCGIRCKKPSMLKKHIRTHSNDRPYTCRQCKFSFKTKGNLTKHMKSKAHTKNYGGGATGTSETDSNKSAHLSGSPTSDDSDDDTDDSGMDSSDESSTRNQEHEAAYGLLSLSQKLNPNTKELPSPATIEANNCSFINAEQLVHVSKTNYAKNKILDQNISLSAIKLVDPPITTEHNALKENDASFAQYIGTSRPLTYPYTTANTAIEEPPLSSTSSSEPSTSSDQSPERNIIHFNVIKRYNPQTKPTPVIAKPKEHVYQPPIPPQQISPSYEPSPPLPQQQAPIVQPPVVIDERKRKLSTTSEALHCTYKMVVNDSEAMDLSVSEKVSKPLEYKVAYKNAHNNNRIPNEENYTYVIETKNVVQNGLAMKMREYDNSAMETLADLATKQEKLEKNSVAKNVATEFLKLATKNENLKTEEKSYVVPTSVVAKSDMIAKNEENKNCTICNKTFNKPSQLRLHMNIHYLERPYRCESCSVSFRTKGHLQKHERSAGHNNKLSTSPALSSMEPRPFKCTDCSIAFRIHGHLAKHLRSKMHILKLECLSKIPFGLYAELERSNSLLTEINTADGDQCLDSLKALAKRIFINDPSKLNQLTNESNKRIEHVDSDTTGS